MTPPVTPKMAPAPIAHVGLAQELAAWLVMLDKWMETFVVIARARAVWNADELANLCEVFAREAEMLTKYKQRMEWLHDCSGGQTDPNQALLLPLDLALIRWSVVCQSWGELSSCHAPLLPAFLAGWCCRCIGADMPVNVGQFKDSFRAGWCEADDQIIIASREKK